jgi:hypothetical protein
MANKDQQVARNLLTYRYNQLDKAIENLRKILVSPMVLLSPNGHNERGGMP